MWRRTVRLIVILTLTILVTPLAAAAQQVEKVYRIGCIPGGPLAPRLHQWDAFRQTLRELGWVEGQNITLEFRPPVREGDSFDDLAADLVRLQVDVIVATGTTGVRAAKQATSTIPIVMSPAVIPLARASSRAWRGGRQCDRHEHHGGGPVWETSGDPQGDRPGGITRGRPVGAAPLRCPLPR